MNTSIMFNGQTVKLSAIPYGEAFALPGTGQVFLKTILGEQAYKLNAVTGELIMVGEMDVIPVKTVLVIPT